jgi:hypothetical protein
MAKAHDVPIELWTVIFEFITGREISLLSQCDRVLNWTISSLLFDLAFAKICRCWRPGLAYMIVFLHAVEQNSYRLAQLFVYHKLRAGLNGYVL